MSQAGKIIQVMGPVVDVEFPQGELPEILVERISHYFQTYKMVPGKEPPVEISKAYDRAHAEKVVRASMADYADVRGSGFDAT